MMIFMMRGMMHGGGASTHQHGRTRSDQNAATQRVDEGDAELRIADLEHEVAALKSGRVRLEKTATGKPSSSLQAAGAVGAQTAVAATRAPTAR